MNMLTCLHSSHAWQLRGSASLSNIEGIWCPECKGYIGPANDGAAEGEIYWKLRCAITERALSRMELLFGALLIGVIALTALRWFL